MVKVNNDQVITSILNTGDEGVEIFITELELTEQDNSNVNEVLTVGLTERGATKGNASLSWGEQIISKLRTDHLNKEEKRALQKYVLIIKMCSTCQGISSVPPMQLGTPYI